MNERAFVRRRKPSWERFEAMLGVLRWSGAGGLSREQLNEVGRLYRQIAADLAYVRTRGGSPQLVDYLNALMGHAHGVLYRQPRGSLASGLKTLFYRFPEVVRHRWRFLLASILLTIGGALFAALLSLAEPAWTERLLDEKLLQVLQEWKQARGRPPGETGLAALMSSFYFTNNTRVSLLAFGLGFFLGIPTVLILWQNGMILGLFSVELARAGKLLFFCASLFPHGVPELSAIFLCGAGGLILGRALLLPGDHTRIEALRLEGRDAFWLLAGSIPLLLFAAFTEAFFSFYAFPLWLKGLYGSVGLTLLLTYWLGVREKEREL